MGTSSLPGLQYLTRVYLQTQNPLPACPSLPLAFLLSVCLSACLFHSSCLFQHGEQPKTSLGAQKVRTRSHQWSSMGMGDTCEGLGSMVQKDSTFSSDRQTDRSNSGPAKHRRQAAQLTALWLQSHPWKGSHLCTRI